MDLIDSHFNENVKYKKEEYFTNYHRGWLSHSTLYQNVQNLTRLQNENLFLFNPFGELIPNNEDIYGNQSKIPFYKEVEGYNSYDYFFQSQITCKTSEDLLPKFTHAFQKALDLYQMGAEKGLNAARILHGSYIKWNQQNLKLASQYFMKVSNKNAFEGKFLLEAMKPEFNPDIFQTEIQNNNPAALFLVGFKILATNYFRTNQDDKSMHYLKLSADFGGSYW
jgi:hypothetical protein